MLIPQEIDKCRLPVGVQPEVESFSATADTFAGCVHAEWDSTGAVTPFGRLPFFIEYLKQAGLFAGWVADCPLVITRPNAPAKRDLLGTVLLSVPIATTKCWRHACGRDWCKEIRQPANARRLVPND